LGDRARFTNRVLPKGGSTLFCEGRFRLCNFANVRFGDPLYTGTIIRRSPARQLNRQPLGGVIITIY
jgi:hypothetical protein